MVKVLIIQKNQNFRMVALSHLVLFRILRQMISFDFFIKGMRILNNESDQHQLLSGNDENEYQAMSCGAFNPRFLAKIKRSKADSTNKNK